MPTVTNGEEMEDHQRRRQALRSVLIVKKTNLKKEAPEKWHQAAGECAHSEVSQQIWNPLLPLSFPDWRILPQPICSRSKVISHM